MDVTGLGSGGGMTTNVMNYLGGGLAEPPAWGWGGDILTCVLSFEKGCNGYLLHFPPISLTVAFPKSLFHAAGLEFISIK